MCATWNRWTPDNVGPASADLSRRRPLCRDPRRGLPQADPAGRETVISCGAAPFNLRLAVRQLGFAADVALLPDPSHPGLLAEIR